MQGVGFRPFVYRLAKRYLINGWVKNAADGVHIHAEGEGDLLDEFILEISENAPASAQVRQIDIKEVPLEPYSTFTIETSEEQEVAETTLVSPDLATCDDCVEELFDPENRRYRYPFINCTNCGPRYTILDRLPYDRPVTSMAPFAMCPSCAHEYADPEDRRFHAQPDACFECGPQVVLFGRPKGFAEAARFLEEAAAADGVAAAAATGSEAGGAAVAAAAAGAAEGESPASPEGPGCDGVPAGVPARWGSSREESDAVFSCAVNLLNQGGILAVKGLGGYHLCCDADNALALETLRTRKRRSNKAFAVMAASVEDARQVCHVSDEEAKLLESPARPIVLLRKKGGAFLARGVADRLTELGVMLPATPVQHLLLHDFKQMGGRMLVMTSANLHDEPIVTSNAQAWERLGQVADAFLGNNRGIRARYDDSVVRVLDAGAAGTAVQFVRRARGYAPQPIQVPAACLPEEGTAGAVFAVGPEQKSTFCLLDGQRAFVSQHIGDLENAETYDAWLEAKESYTRLFEVKPELLAADMHPEYLSTKWARQQDLPCVQVQHHHAHVVSAMVENGLQGPVCGVAFDGTGYGPDGTIWGGEVLLCNTGSYERFANVAYMPMPGGAAAVKNPIRMAFGVLRECDLLEHPAAKSLLERLGENQVQLLDRMVELGLNTPYTSSMGRLFDAASALLGLCDECTYEGEAAVLLEAAMRPVENQQEEDPAALERYVFEVVKNQATETSTALDTSVVTLDPAPVFEALLDDMQAGVPVPVLARRFHQAVVTAVFQGAKLAQVLYGIETVVLSGGVFMNRYLSEHALEYLAQQGFTVALPRDLPPNDGGASLGQAVVAANVPR